MNKVKLFCNECKIDMILVVNSGSSRNHIIKEVYECPKCHVEVTVIYEEKECEV